MKILTPPRRSSHAFTLIELLTVIGIIAILMSILIPTVNTVKENAKRMEAKNTCVGIVTALKAYYQEYNKFPPVAETPADSGANEAKDIVVGDTNTSAQYRNNVIFNTLRAISAEPNTDNQFNRRKIVFYENKAVASSGKGTPRGGFFDRDSSGAAPPPDQAGCLYDPWGHQYNIIMDTNYDNRIDLTGYYTDFAGAENDGAAPRVTVGVFSTGKDEQLGKNGDKLYKNGSETSDDVVSWQ